MLQTKRRARVERGVTLVEGHDELALAVAAGARVAELYLCPELWRAPDWPLVEAVGVTGVAPVELSEAAFRKAAYREGPDGWLAVVADPAVPLASLALPPDPLVLVCEQVEKPGNLGAMLRTADAAGVAACVAVSPATDWGNPNVVRASKGTVFTVPVASAASDDEALAWARAHGLRLVAASPSGTVDYTDADADADLAGPVAVVVGAEHEGLSERWLAEADVAVRIPMFGRVNSLNVATSAALLLYEARRQRSRQRRG